MTRRKNKRPASEVLDELQADPLFKAKRHAKHREVHIHAEAEQDVLRALAMLGYPANSFEELLRENAPISADLAQALLTSLPAVTDTNVQEMIVRMLGSARESFDASPLIELFENTESESTRWAIANTMAELRPLPLREWLVGKLLDPSSGKAREMFALAVARTSAPSEANRVLLKLMTEFPGHAAMALGESGGPPELEILQRLEEKSKGWVRREIKKAKTKIRGRL